MEIKDIENIFMASPVARANGASHVILLNSKLPWASVIGTWNNPWEWAGAAMFLKYKLKPICIAEKSKITNEATILELVLDKPTEQYTLILNSLRTNGSTPANPVRKRDALNYQPLFLNKIAYFCGRIVSCHCYIRIQGFLRPLSRVWHTVPCFVISHFLVEAGG